MVDEIHVKDAGTKMTFTVRSAGKILDLSTATAKTAIFDKPRENNIFQKDLIFVTDGTDGKVRYVSEENFLSINGGWRLQLHFTFPTGAWYTNIVDFTVVGNIDYVAI